MTVARFTLNCLFALSGVALVEAFLGWLPYTAIELLLSLLVLLFSAKVANALFALFTRATPVAESPYITALILFFALTPVQSARDALLFMVIAAIAMLSKYVLAYKKVHIFNPALFGILCAGLTSSGLVSWWIATPAMLIAVAVFGYLTVRKSQSDRIFWTFLGAAFFCYVLSLSAYAGANIVVISKSVIQLMISAPVLFFAAFILTDPQTAPQMRSHQNIYAGLVGSVFQLIYMIPVVIGGVAVTSGISGLLGNVYAFVFEQRKRHSVIFRSARKQSRNIYEYSFKPTHKILFKPGQYFEFSIPHKSADVRGNRRIFWASSSPTDPVLRICTIVPNESSTFKDALVALKRGDVLSITGPYGDSFLPKDPAVKICVIAEGIGIVPFMSTCRYLSDRHERRDSVLIYSARTPLDLVYMGEIDAMKDSIGLRVIYVPLDFTELANWNDLSGVVTSEFIKKHVPDIARRESYTVLSSGVVIHH